MGLTKRVLNYLADRKNNISNGNINSIPSPFKRFSDDLIGVQQGIYTLITSSTKGISYFI